MLTTDQPPATEQAIVAVEDRVGDRFPEAYRRFLLRHDGGIPRVEASFRISPDRSSAVNVFLHTRTGEPYSLLEGAEFHDESFPTGFWPIAETGSGDKLVIAVSGPRRGQVLFWHHDRPADTPVDEASDLSLVATDFDDFVASLHLRADKRHREAGQPVYATGEPPADETAIAAVEAAVGGPMPGQYRAFLKRSNGGRPDLCLFELPDGNESVVQRFYGAGVGGDNDLMTVVRFRADYLPDGFLPIGFDPGGDSIVLGLTGANRGRLFFNYHDREAPEPIPESPHLLPLAPSFDAFTDLLRPDE